MLASSPQSRTALFSFALSLYLASVAHAEPAVAALSDANLFEVHLQQSSSSVTHKHKNLPSDMLNHRERDEENVVAPVVLEVESVASPLSSSAVSQPSSIGNKVDSVTDYTFSPKQPSHMIRHTRKLGKRRLPVESSENLVERDSSNDADDFSVLTNLHSLGEMLWSWTDEDGKEGTGEIIEGEVEQMREQDDTTASSSEALETITATQQRPSSPSSASLLSSYL